MDPDYRERRRRERRESQAARDRDASSHGQGPESSKDSAEQHQHRRRKGHRATDSSGNVLSRTAAERKTRHQSDSERDSASSPRKGNGKPRGTNERRPSHSRRAGGHSTPSGSGSREQSSQRLSLDAVAKLDKQNVKKAGWKSNGYDYDEIYLQEVREKERRLEKDRLMAEREEKRRERREREAVGRAEAGDSEKERSGAYESEKEKRRAYESKKEKRRVYESEKETRKAHEKNRAYESEKEKRRTHESDGLTDSETKRRREGRRSREKKAATTDDEREKWRSAYTDADRDKRRKRTDTEEEEKRRQHEAEYTPSIIAEKKEKRRREKQKIEQQKRRVISGPLAEEGGVDDDSEHQYMMEKRGGAGTVRSDYTEEEIARRKRLKRIIIGVVAVLLLLAIIIPVAVLVTKKHGGEKGESVAASNAQQPTNSNLNGHDRNSVPEADRGTILDPWSWWDTTDFNVTYTSEKVGGLPIIGLNATWDDDVTANDKVPNLKDAFSYGKMPVRGVNVGGWLNLEPFITPSMFSSYGVRDGVVDEWTLSTKLGASQAKSTLERHYAAFVTRQTFVDIRNAGFDHVRIPFGYWMVTTYSGDPYVSQVSWRYLLRGIEYARQNGLRVNLDMHGAPGSQNGWNHSGRQGVIGWLNGTDGELNGQRWLDIHHQLSVFFAQPRYRNVVTMYGLVNEPRMVDMNTNVVLNWTQRAIDQVRSDNISAVLVFGDGFLGLDKWQGRLQNNANLLLDVHQYVIFNTAQLSLSHTDKLFFACAAWTQQSQRSMDTATGFGPTMCGEWSQADTDCTPNINNVGIGTRWEGTYDTGNKSTSILTPQCPAKDASCSCNGANADPSTYSAAYKQWLYQFAVAQMISFEAGWGWFYWTWETEKATQWSWKLGMKAGILPQKVWDRQFSCPTKVGDLQDYGKLGLAETY